MPTANLNPGGAGNGGVGGTAVQTTTAGAPSNINGLDVGVSPANDIAANSAVPDTGAQALNTAGNNNAASNAIDTPAGAVESTATPAGPVSGNASQSVEQQFFDNPANRGVQTGNTKNYFDQFTDWASKMKPDTGMNLAGNVLRGVAQGYEANRNYDLKNRQLGIIQQQMAWGNSAPRHN
jgi:hypothetical protein